MRILPTSLLEYNTNKKQVKLNPKNNVSFKSYEKWNMAFNELWNAEFKTGQPAKNKEILDKLVKNILKLVNTTRFDVVNPLYHYKLGEEYTKGTFKGFDLDEYIYSNRFEKIESIPDSKKFLWTVGIPGSYKNKLTFLRMTLPKLLYTTDKSWGKSAARDQQGFGFLSTEDADNRIILFLSGRGLLGDLALARGKTTEKVTGVVQGVQPFVNFLKKVTKLNLDDGYIEFYNLKSGYPIAGKANRKLFSKTFYEQYDNKEKAINRFEHEYAPKIEYDDDIPEVSNSYLLKSEDILKPEQIRDLKYGKDYTLLVVQKDSKYADLKTAIMPFSYSDEYLKSFGYNEMNRRLGSTFDSQKLYFMPIVPNSNYKISDDDIIFAVKRDNISIFNKKLRDREFILEPAQKEKYNRTCDFGPYLTNIYTLNEANKLLLENKEGFSPEVMMSFGAISKKDFITPDVAKSIISTQKDYTFEEDDRKFWNKFKFVDKSFKVENDCLNNGSKFDCSKDINENRTLANALKSLVKFNKW